MSRGIIMPALNFMPAFAPGVKSGLKTTSIRQGDRISVGDRLVLYTGMRQKGPADKLRETFCVATTSVLIDRDEEGKVVVRLGMITLSDEEVEALARRDTCELWDRDFFLRFFSKTYGLPFVGQLIVWI